MEAAAWATPRVRPPHPAKRSTTARAGKPSSKSGRIDCRSSWSPCEPAIASSRSLPVLDSGCHSVLLARSLEVSDERGDLLGPDAMPGRIGFCEAPECGIAKLLIHLQQLAVEGHLDVL